jgi:hypothetical protein
MGVADLMIDSMNSAINVRMIGKDNKLCYLDPILVFSRIVIGLRNKHVEDTSNKLGAHPDQQALSSTNCDRKDSQKLDIE